MASFGGADLGVVTRCKTTPAPLERQTNAANGVDGLESIVLGARGGRTVIEGVIAGVDENDLESIKAVFFTLQLNGSAFTLVDNKGTTWPNVVLVLFDPDGERKLLAGGYGIMEAYTAEFFHLTF